MPKLIFFFILITYLLDFVLMYEGEILSWSPVGVKGLNTRCHSGRTLKSEEVVIIHGR